MLWIRKLDHLIYKKQLKPKSIFKPYGTKGFNVGFIMQANRAAPGLNVLLPSCGWEWERKKWKETLLQFFWIVI